MALVKGICKNFGECDMADNKEVQEVEKSNFVCEECGKPLHPVDGGSKTAGSGGGSGPGSNKKLMGIIAGAVLGVAAIGGGIYALTGGSDKQEDGEKPQAPRVSVALNHTQKTLKVGETDTLVATVTPSDVNATILWRPSKKSNAVEVSNGIVTAKEEGESKVQVQVIANGDTVSSICSYIVEKADKAVTEVKPVDKPVNKPTNGYGTVDLGYGSYTGDLKNGKPHGHGTITYKTSRKVVSWGDEVAKPGDKFEGDFRDGAINGLGYLKTRDGNVIAIQ